MKKSEPKLNGGLNDVLKKQKLAVLIIHILVVASYTIKSLSKALFGFFILHSTPLIIDAVHGSVDILEHIIISIAGHFARKEPDEKYPVGRKTLLDIVGLAIGISVLSLSISCFVNAIRGGQHKYLIQSRENIAYVGIIFLACSCISWITFVFEKRLAVRYSLREYVDDANELGQDAILELAAGLAAVIAWGVSYYWPNTIEIVHSVTYRIMLLGIGAYLLYHGIYSAWENLNNLMNPGLDKTILSELTEHIGLNLPAGCQLIYTEGFPLKTFSRADDLYIFGTLDIEQGLQAESKRIQENAEIITQKYLSYTGKNLIITFYLQTSSENQNRLDEESNILLSKIWGLDSNSTLTESFYLLRKGDIVGSYDAVRMLDLLKFNAKERELYIWICCQKTLYIDGPSHPDAYKVENQLHKEIEYSMTTPSTVMFAVWQLFRIVLSGDLFKGEYFDKIKSLIEKMKRVIQEHKTLELDPIILAECAFVLGIYYERSCQYEIGKSTDYYKTAERFYLESGIVSEADRLYNSWGHQKTLLYELQEAIVLLEKSMEIKKQKGNDAGIVGMSYTLGCLADAYSRSALFDKANGLYLEDLRLIKEAQLPHLEHGVSIKRAESLIRRGVCDGQNEQIAAGVTACRQVFEKNNLPNETSFFAAKALLKGLLWLYESTDNKIQHEKYISESLDLCKKMSSFSEYSKAFLLRLKGRMLGCQGSYNEAYKYFTKSEALFISMSRGLQFRNSAIQSIVCKLESSKYSILENSSQLSQMEIAVEELQRFITPLRGLLGDVQNMLEEELDFLRKSLKALKKKKNTDREYINKNIIKPANKLIALIEG